MASGYFSASILSGHYTLRVDWTSTPNTATNTSNVTVTAKLINDWSLEVGSRTVSNVINGGDALTYTADGIHSTGEHTLGSVTKNNIAHNSDGSKAITIQVTYPIKATIRDTYYSEIVATQSVTLDNIPRQSTISSVSPSNVTVGSSGGSVTVNIARNSSSFTHTVVWSFGSNSYTQTGQTTSATYTIPASWLSAIPSSPTGTGTVTVTTYNGNTQIGSAVSTTFTITAGVYPSIGSVTTAARGAAYTAGVSGYIAGYSTALVSASSVAGVNGSSISKYEFLQDGTVKATYNSSASSYSWTSGTLSGNTTFSVRVTDSRGRQTTKAATAISVSQYAVPAITANAFRSNSAGTADASGTYIRITASATATPSANSITALTYATKATTSSSWSGETNVGSGVTASGFANTTSYDVRVKATDKLGQTSYKYFTIPTQAYTMDFKVGGKGVAFGKVAETDNLVDSEWKIKSSDMVEAAKGFVMQSTNDILADALLQMAATVQWYWLTGGSYTGTIPNNLYKYGMGYVIRRHTTDITVWLFPQGTSLPPVVNTYGSNGWSGWVSYVDYIPDASASQKGLVTTGTQTFAGEKHFAVAVRTSALEFADISSSAGNGGYIDFHYNGSTADYTSRIIENASGTLRMIASLVVTGSLTLGSALAIGNGGTGATSAKAARANLGLTTGGASSAITTTEGLKVGDVTNYSAFILACPPSGGGIVTTIVPKSALSGTATTWQVSDNSNWVNFALRIDGTGLYAKISGSSGSAGTAYLYGLFGA